MTKANPQPNKENEPREPGLLTLFAHPGLLTLLGMSNMNSLVTNL